MSEFNIGDEVFIDDTLSLQDECIGKITELLPDDIYEVTFDGGKKTYHEGRYLINWPFIESVPDFTSYCREHKILYTECGCNPF